MAVTLTEHLREIEEGMRELLARLRDAGSDGHVVHTRVLLDHWITRLRALAAQVSKKGG